MASPPLPPTPRAKLLKEHLQKQQEPFTLNLFLSESGYLVKCMSSNGRNGCCRTNLFKNLDKKMMLISKRVVKSIDSMLYKLVSANVDDDDDSRELSCCSDNKDHQDELQTEEIPYGFGEVINGFPFGASPSCIVEEEYLASKYQHRCLSQTSNLGDVEPQKDLTDKSCQTKCTHDKYINLMSILNKLSSDRVNHIITRQEIPSSRNSTLTENGKGGSFIFTPFPWKLLAKSVMERYTLIGFKEGKGVIGPYSSNYEFVNQREEKSIKSDDDKKSIRNKYNYMYWFIGVEKLGNLIRAQKFYSYKKNSQQIYSYRKNSGLSSMNFSDTLEEWNYTQKLQRKVSFELGDTIMDEIVEETILLLR